MNSLIGKVVWIKKGVCGEGFGFVVSALVKGERGWQVYGNGNTYGPVRIEDIAGIDAPAKGWDDQYRFGGPNYDRNSTPDGV